MCVTKQTGHLSTHTRWDHGHETMFCVQKYICVATHKPRLHGWKICHLETQAAMLMKRKKTNLRNLNGIYFMKRSCHVWILIRHSVFPLGFHFSTQKVALLCCHWRTIIDIYIWVLMVRTLAFICECLPVTLRKQCFLYRKGSETWGMGVLVYCARFMHCLSGIGGCFYAVHQNPLQTVSWIMQCFRWKYSLGHLLSLQTGVLHWAWRVVL